MKSIDSLWKVTWFKCELHKEEDTLSGNVESWWRWYRRSISMPFEALNNTLKIITNFKRPEDDTHLQDKLRCCMIAKCGRWRRKIQVIQAERAKAALNWNRKRGRLKLSGKRQSLKRPSTKDKHGKRPKLRRKTVLACDNLFVPYAIPRSRTRWWWVVVAKNGHSKRSLVLKRHSRVGQFHNWNAIVCLIKINVSFPINFKNAFTTKSCCMFYVWVLLNVVSVRPFCITSGWSEIHFTLSF